MVKISECSEEVKKRAFEKSATISIYHLNLFLEIIDLSSSRGAFKGNELSLIGSIYDVVSTGVNKAIELSKEEEPKS